MTISNHMLVGAVIALTVKQPILVLPLALASHFVVDAIPHFGYPAPLDQTWNHGPMTAEAVFTIISTAILIVTPGLWTPLVAAAALLAMSPDLFWMSRYVVYERRDQPTPPSRFEDFHSWWQWSERPWGFYVEVISFIVGYICLVRYLL